jgi:hypothetical protein
MKSIKTIAIGLLFSSVAFGQTLPPKQAAPFNVKQIHSGHSLTDPLFSNWPGQYVNLIAHQNSLQAWQYQQKIHKTIIYLSSNTKC